MNVETGGAQVRGLKAALEAQVPALAASLDGLTFTYISPVTAPQAAGGYVTVETPDGPRLGQIRQAVVEQAEGPEIGAAVGGFDNVRMRIRFDRLTGAGIPAGTAELLITREWAILAGENDYTTGTFAQITGHPPRPVAEFLHQHRAEFA